jgi:hypothetical protein
MFEEDYQEETADPQPSEIEIITALIKFVTRGYPIMVGELLTRPGGGLSDRQLRDLEIRYMEGLALLHERRNEVIYAQQKG